MKIKVLNEAAENLKQETTADVAQDIQQGAAEKGKKVDAKQAAEHAKDVKEVAKLIRNPYGTAKMSEVEEILQYALDAALDAKEAGYDADYPNVIIYGLAGFGKTALVKNFCKKHNANFFECDAKNLDAATVGGIPYPVDDFSTSSGTKRQKSAPLSSSYWDPLFKENCILVLDELNRANQNVIGSLLTLINNHDLPMMEQDTETGEVRQFHHFDNLLFTVIMFNPATIFDVEPLDPAVISRNIAIYEQKPDKREFLNVLKNQVFDVILANPILKPELKLKYQGQKDLAEAMLGSAFLKFDDTEACKRIYQSQRQGIYNNYLNYRTLTGILLACDGTKASFLKALKWARFTADATRGVENSLQGFTDKISKSNNPFQQNTVKVNPEKEAQTEAGVKSALASFLDNLSK